MRRWSWRILAGAPAFDMCIRGVVVGGLSSWWLSEGFRPVHLFFAIVMLGGPVVGFVSHELSKAYHRPPASFSDLGRADPTLTPGVPSPIAGTTSQPKWHPPFVAPTPTQGRKPPPAGEGRTTGRPPVQGRTSPPAGTIRPPASTRAPDPGTTRPTGAPSTRPPKPSKPPVSSRPPEPEPSQPKPEPSTKPPTKTAKPPVPPSSTGGLPGTSSAGARDLPSVGASAAA